MKKNFISILILGCTLINVVLSAITMFSVVSTNQKTAEIVTSVAKVLDIELGGTETEEKENEIPIILHCAKSPIPVLTSNPSTDTGRNSIAHPKSITTTSNLSPIRFFLLLFSCLFFTYYLQGYILYNYISLVL